MKGLLSIVCAVEILLLIGMSFSASHFIGQVKLISDDIPSESIFITRAREIFISFFGSNLVSAQEALFTCPIDLNGSACQEYPSSTCNQQCSTTCFPGLRSDFAQCRLGTCIDQSEGTCSPNSPQQSCTNSGGIWKQAAATTLAECRPGCCLIGNQAQYVTEATCSVLSQRLGRQSEFRDTQNEVECLALAAPNSEGACVLGETDGGGKNCKFTTNSDCAVSGGEFHENLLCSNEDLGTICKRQDHTSCVENKDEVYWFDSCGNRENIYDSNKIKSWNLGKILPKSQSCSLGTVSDILGNQASCGNCNYLLGSVCGARSAGDPKPSDGIYLCKDLSCVDENGKKRSNGESWCAFDGRIGVDGTGNGERSVDVPGSRDYRKSCLNGQIITDSCSDFRNEICVESRDSLTQFSSAACRINRWQVCIDANTDKNKLDKCEENSDCFLKSVKIDKFQFDICAPKYPPGFDLKADRGGQVGESVCSLASQTCTAIYVKELTGWKCKANCNCRKSVFTETMNNLCISLGDCGAHVNVEGEFSDQGYSVKNAPKLAQTYINGLKTYSKPLQGQKADPGNFSEIIDAARLDQGSSPAINDPSKGFSTLSIFSGLAGIALVYGAKYSIVSGALASTGLTTAGSAGVPFTGTVSSLAGFSPAVSPGLTAVGGAFAGALVGAAITGFLINYLGIGRGLPAAATYGFVLAGAYSGAAIGYGAITGTSPGWVAAGPIVAIIVIVVIVILALLGIGKTKKVKVTFTCSPWQPPRGGASCDKCGDNGLPCSKYKCQSLGQTCSFINEGTNDQACVDISPNDVTAPAINPNEGALKDGFSYSNIVRNGFSLKSSSGDGCIPAFTQVGFGVSTNEPAQCKIESVHTQSFDEMGSYFGESNLYSYNHSTQFVLPSLESLGEDGIDPNRKADLSLYVRCSDLSGNKNVEEYSINFCVSPEKDITPPIIDRFNPQSPAYAPFTGNTRDVSFFVNEPAECKWDTSDKPYNDLRNIAHCETDIEEGTAYGWPCNTTINILQNDTSVYFRCRDQPWLTGENASGRNTNTQGVLYTIKRSTSPLSITSVSPNGTITSGGYPAVVDLEVRTSGGAAGLRRFCDFNFGSGFVQFFDTGTDIHKQRGLNLFSSGEYSIPIKCEDEAGNNAQSIARFSVNIDSTGPRITRIYDDGSLNIVTNEPSICAVSFDNCGFIFENGTRMNGNDLVHSSIFVTGRTQYVKCKDRFNNPSSCVAVRGGAF